MDERAGRIEVIAGPMFAGKTEELLRRVRRAVIGGRRVEVFTHALDTRGQGRIASHAGLDFLSRAAPSAAVIAEQVKADTDLVALDEAHFVGSDLVPSRTSWRTAVCTVCGADAVFHERVRPASATDTELVPEHVGGSEKYQARCRRHFRGSDAGTRARA